MFTCSWCKKKNIDPDGWSKYKEPLCSECIHKYNFGVEREIITDAVERLSKFERRMISEVMNKAELFFRAMKLVGAERLTGFWKYFSATLSLSLVLLMILLVRYIWINYLDFAYDIFPLNLILMGGGVFISFLVLHFLIERIIWFTKFFQLKNRVRKMNYKWFIDY